jgi:hypothetical protein
MGEIAFGELLSAAIREYGDVSRTPEKPLAPALSCSLAWHVSRVDRSPGNLGDCVKKKGGGGDGGEGD